MLNYFDYTKYKRGWFLPIILIFLILIFSNLFQYFPTGIKYGTWNADIILSNEEAKKFGISYVFNDSITIQRDVVLSEFIIWNNSKYPINIKESNPLILGIIGEGLFIDCQIKKTKKIKISEINFNFIDNCFEFTSFTMYPDSAILLQVLAVNYDPSWSKLFENGETLNPTEIRFLKKDISYLKLLNIFMFIMITTFLFGKKNIEDYETFLLEKDFLDLGFICFNGNLIILLTIYFKTVNFFPVPF